MHCRDTLTRCLRQLKNLDRTSQSQRGLLIAHGKPSALVPATGQSLLVILEGIEFKQLQNDPVQLVFDLAAIDHESHIGVMAEPAEYL